LTQAFDLLQEIVFKLGRVLVVPRKSAQLND